MSCNSNNCSSSCGDSGLNNNNNGGVQQLKSYSDEYIYYQEGNIPVILTFPHSGFLQVEGVSTRKHGVIDKDDYTDLTAISLIKAFNCVDCCCSSNRVNDHTKPPQSIDASDELQQPPSGKCYCRCIDFEFNGKEYQFNQQCPRPFIVYSKINRTCCDFNRKEDIAYENPIMKQHYNTYHGTIQSFIEKSKALSIQLNNNNQNNNNQDNNNNIPAWSGHCLLLDVHGQSDCRGYILRGTKDMRTVQPLLARHGLHALIGPNSIFGGLSHLGIPVYPETIAVDSPHANIIRQQIDQINNQNNNNNNINNQNNNNNNNQSNINNCNHYNVVPIPNTQQNNQNNQNNILKFKNMIPTTRSKTTLDGYHEHPRYNGAYTVQNYSAAPYNIDCIQIEIGVNWRQTDSNRLQLARSLRDSILVYYHQYIKNRI